MNGIDGRVAFITGGSSGIGLGIAKAFAESGVKIALGYRREAHLAQALELLGGLPDIHPIRLDVTDRAAFNRAADTAEARFGRIDILVNNAGLNLFGPMDIATHDDWDWVLGVNLGGVVNGLVSVLPKIKAHGDGGHVVNVASMASFIAGAEAGIYTTSKFAVRGLTECLRLTLAPQGIGVSLVAPGLTNTNIHEAPLTRPDDLSVTAFPSDATSTDRVHKVLNLGADPFEIGRRIRDGVIANEPYIFTHPGFRTEFEEDFADVLTAMPDAPYDPRHAKIEEMRRDRKRTGKARARENGLQLQKQKRGAA